MSSALSTYNRWAPRYVLNFKFFLREYQGTLPLVRLLRAKRVYHNCWAISKLPNPSTSLCSFLNYSDINFSPFPLSCAFLLPLQSFSAFSCEHTHLPSSFTQFSRKKVRFGIWIVSKMICRYHHAKPYKEA